MTGVRLSAGLTGERGIELAPEINAFLLFHACLPSTLPPEPKLWSWAEGLPGGAGGMVSVPGVTRSDRVQGEGHLMGKSLGDMIPEEWVGIPGRPEGEGEASPGQRGLGPKLRGGSPEIFPVGMARTCGLQQGHEGGS